MTVPFDREAKKEVGECPVDTMMRVVDSRWKGTTSWNYLDAFLNTNVELNDVIEERDRISC